MTRTGACRDGLEEDYLAATATRSVAALLALSWCAYAHVAAAALLADGVDRTAYW